MINKQQNNSLLDDVFQLLPSPISVTKVNDSTCVAANHAFLKYFGLRRKDVIGKKSFELGMISPETKLPRLNKLRKTDDVQDTTVKLRSRKNSALDMPFKTKRIKVNGLSYYLSLGNDVSVMEYIRKARQFDTFVQSLDTVKETGIIFVSDYDKKKPSVAYANEEAQSVLQIHAVKKILKMLHGHDSIFLKTPSFIYFVRNIPCQDDAPLKILFLRRLMDATTCMTMRLKEFNLTSRERQVALMAAYGHSNSVIAENLGISNFTVKDHLKRIFKIIGVHKRNELFLKLMTLG